MQDDQIRKRISVIGSGQCSPKTSLVAEKLGCLLAKENCILICGGLGGVMQAAARGAKKANGLTIGLLPGDDHHTANPYIDIAIATGLGPMRNYQVVLNGDLVIAVEGGSGTLSEIGLALKIGRRVIALGQWASLPQVIPAKTPEQAIQVMLDL